MSQLKHLTLLAGCSLLFSCASAKIAVEVDIYDEDPRVVLPSTPQDNLDLLAQSQVLLLEAASDKQRSQRSFEEYLAQNMSPIDVIFNGQESSVLNW